MTEIFLIGHGFMLYDNVDGVSTATRMFSKPGNVDIVFYIGEYTSAYGPTTLVAISRNVTNSEIAAIGDRVEQINLESRLDTLSLDSPPDAPTDCTAILATEKTPNHFLIAPAGDGWEHEYIRVLQGWAKPQGWAVMQAGDFPTCRAQYGDRVGASLSSIAMYCSRTNERTVIHWLVCRAPLQTTPRLAPQSPLKAPVAKEGHLQKLRDNVDKFQAFSLKAKSFGVKLKKVHQYQSLGNKWVNFELKYFVISDLSVKVLGGGDAMKQAASSLLDETDGTLAEARNTHDRIQKMPNMSGSSTLDASIPGILEAAEGLRKLLRAL